MRQDRLAVIIPIYKKMPSSLEIMALERIVSVFKGRKIIFLAPGSLDTSWYEASFSDIVIHRLNDDWFSDLDAYNQMLLDVLFYQEWLRLGLDGILVCQLDVYVISDCLNDFWDMSYDYIGAPLFRLEDDRPCFYGGNGGFSLRDLRACIRVLKAHADLLTAWNENEDEFFSYCGEAFPDEFHVAPPHVASRFAFDRFARVLYRCNQGNLPAAIHGWCTYDPDFTARVIGLTDEMKRCHDIRDIRKMEEERCMAFARNHQPVILYGAGVWGKVFLRYLRRNGILVRCFAVSDNQPANTACLGVEVRHLSEIPGKYLTDGMMFSVSRRFMGEACFGRLLRRVKQRGFSHCFELGTVLFNVAAESWMEEEFFGD